MNATATPTWSGPTFRKDDPFPGAARLEGQGLTWLGEAMSDGGAYAVPVRFGPSWIEEPRLRESRVTARAAEEFGRALAVTHAAGAPAFGCAPPGWDGKARMGRSNLRLRAHAPEPADQPARTWGEFYAEDRVEPYIRPGRDNGALTAADARVLERVCERLRAGDFDAAQPALVERAAAERGERVAVARTHGDLWCGNVLWVPAEEVAPWAPPGAGDGPAGTESGPAGAGAGPAGTGAAGAGVGATGARAGAAPQPTGRQAHDDWAPRDGGSDSDVVGVLIDPMAHGAHAETDLAALGVFGQPYLERIVAAYDEVSPLTDGWRERIGLHQLHMLMIHVFLFGGGYGPEAAAVARRYA